MAFRTVLFLLLSCLILANFVNSKAVKKHRDTPTVVAKADDSDHSKQHRGEDLKEHPETTSTTHVDEDQNPEGDNNPKPDTIPREHKRPTKQERIPPLRERDTNAGLIKLDEHPSCAEDVERLCHEVPKGNNFAILVCIQDKAKEDEITNECHNLLWSYKKNLTCDTRFENAAKQLCKDDLQKLPYCQHQGEKYPGKGKLVPCLLLHRQNITNTRCKHMMTKMQAIVFSNYHLIDGFFNKCQKDVEKFACGRITQEEEDEDIHTQNDVLECLEKHQEDLAESCQKEIYRMAELSADDYHLDRPLYYACRDDREKFCSEVPAGEGRIYKCLTKHKFEETMTKECLEKLTIKQKIEAKDYKADYGLLQACEKDFLNYRRQYKCETAKTPHGSMASILLCLEKVLNDGKPIDSKCQSELFEVRQQLMEDYSINPEVVASCDVEIQQHCHGGQEKEGKTIDCLMKLAEEGKDNIRPRCLKAVRNLVKETGAGRDYRIDHTLYMACEPVVQTACKDKGKKEGDIMVLSCLMEHLNSDVMNHECREQLLHLQFFIARDFSLDPDLYQACESDAEKHCHAKKFNEENEEVPSGMIVSCLYRNSLEGGEISDKCADHVRRVMHQRAMDVHLIPEVQEACMPDLGQYCSSNLEKGQEVDCLQKNMEKLQDKCKAVIRNFTEEEGEDYQLDQTLVRMCSGMVAKFCEDVINKGESEGVLPCLIEHKNDPEMDGKCRASIEHWQLIEIKDYKFSAKFKKACRKDVEKHCQGSETKHEVIKCLSKSVRDAVINEKPQQISKKCQAELRIAETEEGENIKFDPELFGVCSGDAEKLCQDVTAGQAKVLECLKKNYDSLSKPCQKQLFEREEEEMREPEIDYQLVKTCQGAIELFCSEVDPPDLLRCLKQHKLEPKMKPECRDLVNRRQKKQFEDYKLDPELHGACKPDINKFCSNFIKKHGGGQMVACLKKSLKKLSENCELYIRTVMHEEAMDYRLDPILSSACKREVNKHCADIEPGRGKVEECLRGKLDSMQKESNCYVEVVRTMIEGKTDVYADPVLFEACRTNIMHFCEDVDPGHGRVMSCLIEVKQSKRHKLGRKCNLQLKARIKMWEFAKLVAPESLGDLALAISASPSKNYFFMVFAVALALIFIGGLVFGRLSKRVKRELKDR